MLLQGEGDSKKVEKSFNIVPTIHIIVPLSFLINLRFGAYRMGRTEEGKALVLWVSVASKPPCSVGHIHF